MTRKLKDDHHQAAERYAKLGFPDKYRVTLSGRGYRAVTLRLDEYQPMFSRFRKRFLGYEWVRIREEAVPGGAYWEDQEVDMMAKAWLFEIARHERLREVPPPDWWRGEVDSEEEAC